MIISDAKKGFLRSSVGFARVFLAFGIAFFFSGILASLIDKAWIFSSVHKAITDAFSSDATDPLAALPIGLRAISAISGIDLQKIADKSTAESLSLALAKPISHAISVTLSFVILLIGSYFALKLLVPLFSKMIRSFSFLKAVDTLLGVLFGIFHAFLLAWGLALVFGFLLSLFGVSLEGTVLLRFFNHVSPIKAVIFLFLR